VHNRRNVPRTGFVGRFTKREVLFSRADAEIGDWLGFAVNASGTTVFAEIRRMRTVRGVDKSRDPAGADPLASGG